ncbi:nucleoporin Nup120/160-domain-containing protein, partial [Amylostereum chailletii]
MADKVLVATHLSSLYSPSQTTNILVPTSRRNAPLPPLPSESEPPAEHASFASVFHSTQTGTVLIRVIHHGLILELVSMSTPTPPIRFVFPAAILPNPAILLWHGRELHVLAVTSMGSLYRLVLPLRSPSLLWGEHMGNNWCREYYVRSMQDTVQGVVQVQSTHSVAIALNNGSLVRVDTEFVGDDASDDQWSENVFQHSSFLSSITHFLHSGSSEGSHVVCVASHPQPTDIGHVWTLSRDRTLRLWTAKTGCTAARTLPPSMHTGREITPTPGSSVPAKSTVLLDPEPQHLLVV